MVSLNGIKASTALLLSVTMGSGAIIPLAAPIAMQSPAVAQATAFSDVSQNYWAEDFISSLVNQGIIAGFPDGTFRPDAPVTRSQFAAMLQKAFQSNKTRSSIDFSDVSSAYWAAPAIDNAYEMGFLSGYPGGMFKPEQNIPREQVLVSLANGLNYRPSGNVNTVLGYYSDAASISNFARSPIAAATEKQMVVDYPNLTNLNPTRNATRAEVAAFLYQALVSEGRASTISSQYVVAQKPVATNYRIPAGTTIPVTYKEEKILLAKDESAEVILNVANNITTSNGTILIPSGSQVKGMLQPTANGTQFVAQQLILTNGTTVDLGATSNVVTTTETVTKGTNVKTLVRNAALGTAAAAAISAITGDKAIATEELLIGAGAGVLASLIPQFLGRNRVELITIEPNTDLDLTLSQDLLINNR